MSKTNIPGAWTEQKILETLTLASVRAASKGRPCPVAMLVIARIEGTV